MRRLGDWIERNRRALGAGENPGPGGRIVVAQDEDQQAPEPPSSGDSQGEPARNPWTPDSPPRRMPGLDEMLRGKRGPNGGDKKGGIPKPPIPPGFRMPRRPDGSSWWPTIAMTSVGIVALLTCGHQLSMHEQGIVTTFGKYSSTLQPGFSFTLPWPIQQTEVTDVTTFNQVAVPEGEAENLMLTRDQSLVNISYVVRWNIKDLKLYTYQLKSPKETVTQVAEAAMRATIAEVKLNDVMRGIPSAEIGAHVRQRMQQVLDAYHSGIQVQGVDLKKADPPAKVNDAFQRVQGAMQDANRDIQQARGYAQQTIARAEGEAGAFDRVYTQYKAAPDVTRRRMYYETMDRVLSSNEKIIVPNGTNTWLPMPALSGPDNHRRPPQPEATAGANP